MTNGLWTMMFPRLDTGLRLGFWWQASLDDPRLKAVGSMMMLPTLASGM